MEATGWRDQFLIADFGIAFRLRNDGTRRFETALQFCQFAIRSGPDCFVGCSFVKDYAKLFTELPKTKNP